MPRKTRRRQPPRFLRLEELEDRTLLACLNPGDIVVADAHAFGGGGAVFRVDPVTGAQTVISSGGSFSDPESVAIAPDGDLYVADESAFGGGGGIIRVDSCTGAQSTVSSGGNFVDPRGIAIDANGKIVVSDFSAFGGGSGIIRVNRATGAQTIVSSGGNFVEPERIAIDANGDILVPDAEALKLVRVNPLNGSQTVVSSVQNFVRPFGIAIDPNNDILIADFDAFGGGGGVIRVNPSTGDQTAVSSGGSFVSPVGIAIDANGDILIADHEAFGGGCAFSPIGGCGGVIRVDSLTGTQTTISSGGSFNDPHGIALVPLDYTPPDSTGPRVLFSSPNSNIRGLIDHIDLIYSEAIDPASFAAAGLSLTAPDGVLITPDGDPAALDNTNTSFRITFPSQSMLGNYQLTVSSDIRDAAGNQMDQDQDGQNGEVGDDEFSMTLQLVRTPTLVVPGILGSLTPEIEFTGATATHPFQISRIRKQLRGFLLNRTAFDPRQLGPERLGKAYNEIIDQFERQGFEFCKVHADVAPETDPTCDRDADLFLAAYDWRLPVLVNPNDTTQLLWDSDGVFESGVEYLDWWIDLAKAKWVERYGSADGFAVDIVAHSMGGLVSRSYIEEADDAGQVAETVSHLIMLGTPNHGSVASFQFLKPGVRLFGSFNLGCSSVAALAAAVLGADSNDSCLRAIIKEAMPKRDKMLKLRRGTSQPLDIVPSLRDLQPTFPFFQPLDSDVREIPVSNFLLNRLNATTDDLTAATDVVLIGTDDRSTPVAAEIVRERSSFTRFRSVATLRFQSKQIGDGRVVFDRIPNSDDPAGLVLASPAIDVIAVPNVAHGNLPRNDGVICLVFEELEVGLPVTCA